MNIKENIKISELTTFRTGGNARFFCEVLDDNEILEAINFAKEKSIKFLFLGNGSNLVFSDNDFDGLIIKISTKGIQKEFDDYDFSIVSASAGEKFDDLIDFALKNNLYGIENLWNIPGTVGASVVQNIGAYGVEVKDFLFSVDVIDINTSKKISLKNTKCEFGYRESVFKKNKTSCVFDKDQTHNTMAVFSEKEWSTDHREHSACLHTHNIQTPLSDKNLVIVKVYFKLNKKFNPNIGYLGLKDRFVDQKEILPESIKNIIENIRREKIPDWRVLGTAGSFFKNPILTIKKYEKIKQEYPEIPFFPFLKGRVKIPLGYVLDKICNLKGFKINNVGFYEKQALIVVNYGNTKAEDILSLIKLAEEKVFEKIGIKIEREVELVGF